MERRSTFSAAPPPTTGRRGARASRSSAGASGPACRKSCERSRTAGWPSSPTGWLWQWSRCFCSACRSRPSGSTNRPMRPSKCTRRRPLSAPTGKEARRMGWRVKDRTTNVGFVSTRFAGTDGVSLETHKWATILDGLDFESFYFAGESDTPADRTMVVPEAHFLHPRVVALTERLFGGPTRSAETSREVQQLRDLLKPRLEEFVRTFGIDLLIVENALSLPLNVPLGLALVELIAETGLPTIAHHHDFSWERTRLK